jgi:hypothetical protein
MTGPRRDWEAGRQQRAYTCRACGATERDYWPPFGWLQVRTRDPQAGPRDSTYTILALTCGAACLVRLAGEWAATVDDQAQAEGGRR